MTKIAASLCAGMAIVAAYRTHGHLAAHLDPLGSQPQGEPSLDPANYGLTPALQSESASDATRACWSRN